MAVGEEAKGIGNSTTLSEDAKTEEEAKKVLLMLAKCRQAAEKSRKKTRGVLTVENPLRYFPQCFHQMQVTPSAQIRHDSLSESM